MPPASSRVRGNGLAGLLFENVDAAADARPFTPKDELAHQFRLFSDRVSNCYGTDGPTPTSTVHTRDRLRMEYARLDHCRYEGKWYQRCRNWWNTQTRSHLRISSWLGPHAGFRPHAHESKNLRLPKRRRGPQRNVVGVPEQGGRVGGHPASGNTIRVGDQDAGWVHDVSDALDRRAAWAGTASGRQQLPQVQT